MSDYTVDSDDFARTLTQLMNRVGNNTAKECAEAVDAGAKVCVKTVRANSRNTFKGTKYAKSWRKRTVKTNDGASSTIYSKMPGLPHLLELGHATMHHGGRVPGRSHIKPAAEDAFEVTQDMLASCLDKAIKESI